MTFEHQFIDDDPGYDGWGAMVVADFDGDGRPEFATGGKGGGIYRLFDYKPQTGWQSQVISDAYSPNVGATAVDVNGDGRMGIVCGEWGDRLLWFAQTDNGWEAAVVGDGLDDPHDVLSGDLTGDGRKEVVVREKDGRLMVYKTRPDGEWVRALVASDLAGDGTAIAPIAMPGVMDIVTNQGWFENVNGDGTVWEHHPLLPDDLEWHPESRLVVGDLDGDGQNEVVITESEIWPARMAILKAKSRTSPWRANVLIDRDANLSALHSLQLLDAEDGGLEIFTAEMENGKTDSVERKPRWLQLKQDGGTWVTETILDANLGTHSAAAADFDGDGRLEFVGKVWRANAENANGGRNHIDWVKPTE